MPMALAVRECDLTATTALDTGRANARRTDAPCAEADQDRAAQVGGERQDAERRRPSADFCFDRGLARRRDRLLVRAAQLGGWCPQNKSAFPLRGIDLTIV
jgi:hypothetical protein